jgi:signal transduction histidine kinase
MDAPKEKLNKSVGVINEMCNRIRRIVKDLSRISEPVRIERQELSLNMVLEETLRILTETAGRIKKFKVDDPEAPFVIKKRLDPKLPIIIGDSQQLSQVFMNLIINASDAMDALGHGTLTVGTRYDAGRKVVIGSITDTGIGIPVEIRDKIFQPYFTTKAKGKGTGLGLAIIRSIIEAHEGRISVQSVEGAGTRFEFELPVKSPEEMKAIMRAQMEAMV